MRRKVARMIAAKSFLNTDMERLPELLELMDFIDKQLESYKTK